MVRGLSIRIPPLRTLTKPFRTYVPSRSKESICHILLVILRSAFEQKFKIFLYLGLCLVLYNEWICYWISPLFWPSLSFTATYQKFYKVLVVADPQILGERNELPFSRWDNDRYLAKTYSEALSYVKPDLILFLGDIMDEGHFSHDEHFNKYFSRVKQIFQLDKIFPREVLFLPGDNDIGGEEDEISLNKLNRFNNHFNVSAIAYHGGIQFAVVNKLTRSYPSMIGHSNTSLRIVVSHLPLLTKANDFGYEVVNNLHPHLILSAHDHLSTHLIWDTADDPSYSKTRVETYAKNSYTGQSLWRLNVGQKGVVQELVVPTCSYRMGVLQMAYGFMFIDKERFIVNYGLLWLPSRLFQLFVYMAYSVTAIFILIVKYKTPSSDILNMRKYYHHV